jgi:hypothetical protein
MNIDGPQLFLLGDVIHEIREPQRELPYFRCALGGRCVSAATVGKLYAGMVSTCNHYAFYTDALHKHPAR